MKNPLVSDATATINDEIQAAQERGEDVFGDDEPLVRHLPTSEGDADSDSADAGDAGDDTDPPADGASDDEGAIDQAALEAVASEDAPARPTYDRPEARDFDAERKTLRGSKSDIQKQWNDGELSDEEYAAKVSEVDDQLDALLTAKVKAETIEDLNRQAVIQTQQQVLESIRATSKKANELDYADIKVATAYDKMLGAVMADPDNGGKTFAELAQLAHDALCTTRGVKRAAPAADPNNPKPRREAPVIPTTLRGLPNASVSNTGGSRIDAISKLTGPAYQEAFEKLSPAEKAALLDE